MLEEKVTGTTAHILCKALKRPVQLQGPEHYCDYLKDFVVTAAPIFDKSGEVRAILALSLPLVNPPSDKNYQIISYYTLACRGRWPQRSKNTAELRRAIVIWEKSHNLLNTTCSN
jgi:hypothetical protein